ncbi:MAG TPA: hypothetical protein VF783_00140, partial [Terriglobales bacterium]
TVVDRVDQPVGSGGSKDFGRPLSLEAPHPSMWTVTDFLDYGENDAGSLRGPLPKYYRAA